MTDFWRSLAALDATQRCQALFKAADRSAPDCAGEISPIAPSLRRLADEVGE